LNKTQSPFLYITGHTDGRASDAYNKALAERRVETVQNFVMQLGISQDSLKLAAYGEHQPIASNETETGRAQNRRVEVYWITPIPQGPYTTIADLYRKIAQKPQIFWLRADQERDTIIRTQEGTSFLIPKGAFRCDAHFDYSKPIRFEVKEYLTAAEMLQGNLHSMSQDKLLQTGGMMYIAAYQGEQAIELCDDRSIAFFVPSENPMESMYRFDGISNSGDDLDWQLGDSLQTFNSSIPRPPVSREDTVFNRVHLASGLKTHLAKVLGGASSPTFGQMVASSRMLRGVISSNTSFNYGDGWYLNWSPAEGNCTICDYDPITSEAYVEELSSFNRYVDDPAMICDTILPIQPSFSAWGNTRLSPGVQRLVGDASGYLGEMESLGNINCDRFMGNFVKSLRVQIRTDAVADSSTDVKLIIPRVRGIMTSFERSLNGNGEATFAFSQVPAGLSAILLGLRYEKGQAYIAISRIRTSGTPASLEFKAIEEDKIPARLARIGF